MSIAPIWGSPNKIRIAIKLSSSCFFPISEGMRDVFGYRIAPREMQGRIKNFGSYEFIKSRKLVWVSKAKKPPINHTPFLTTFTVGTTVVVATTAVTVVPLVVTRHLSLPPTPTHSIHTTVTITVTTAVVVSLNILTEQLTFPPLPSAFTFEKPLVIFLVLRTVFTC
jgi:hypothetical protein